jgi:hypothetical protein
VGDFQGNESKSTQQLPANVGKIAAGQNEHLREWD